ncbi:response regulator [Vogesella fluminis]|uniref:response regulator n=1 Tax=Vogesella fluminis TaxID=1069161 RepID=UPI003631636D
MIVDDEKDVHTATRLAIQDLRYKERPLTLLNAYSAQQGFELVREHPDIALILLDVVMETDNAGLKLVHRIREELGNSLARIVLRTGQPGQAPEQDVILNYDINDYKTKTELTVQKLFTVVIASLRAYENLVAIEKTARAWARSWKAPATCTSCAR